MTDLQTAVEAVPGVTWLQAAPIVPTVGAAWVDDAGLRVITGLSGGASTLAPGMVTAALAAVPGYSTSDPSWSVWRWDSRQGFVYLWESSDVLTGDPVAPTPSPGDADTSVATTEFVASEIVRARTIYLPTGYQAVYTEPFTVAHRGGGYVRPEHTIEAYTGALDTGVTMVEISAQPLADGTWICMHDSTFDRTTNLVNGVGEKTWPEAHQGVVDIGAQLLGPSWGTQEIPTVRHALHHVGGKAVCFVEPKASNSLALTSSLLALMLDHGPPESYVWKTAATEEGGIPPTAVTAQGAGVPVWAYLPMTASNAVVDATAEVADMLGVEATAGDAHITYVVGKGLPVIAYPVIRRYRRDQLRALGVDGVMASTAEYLARDVAVLTGDTFGAGVRQAGDLPYGDNLSLYTWDQNSASMILPGSQTTASLMLGSLGPITADTYAITFDMKWPTLPSGTLHSDFVFCQEDDYQYAHQSTANTSGYHLVMRTTGSLELYKHVNGSGTGTRLGDPVVTTQPVADTWMSFRIDVTPTTVSIDRTDVTTEAIVVGNTEFRGGYVHLAAASTDQPVHYRSIVVTEA